MVKAKVVQGKEEIAEFKKSLERCERHEFFALLKPRVERLTNKKEVE